MYHNLLHDPKIFQLLYRVDEALAEEARTTRCACGGKWHRADYPRKPRGLRGFRMQYASRFSFCCRSLPQAQNMTFRAVFRAQGVADRQYRATDVRRNGAISKCLEWGLERCKEWVFLASFAMVCQSASAIEPASAPNICHLWSVITLRYSMD